MYQAQYIISCPIYNLLDYFNIIQCYPHVTKGQKWQKHGDLDVRYINVSHRSDRQFQSEPQCVSNPNDLLEPCQTRSSWQGSYQPESWVVMWKARPEAASQAKPSRGSPSLMRPWETAQTAHGLGSWLGEAASRSSSLGFTRHLNFSWDVNTWSLICQAFLFLHRTTIYSICN